VAVVLALLPSPSSPPASSQDPEEARKKRGGWYKDGHPDGGGVKNDARALCLFGGRRVRCTLRCEGYHDWGFAGTSAKLIRGTIHGLGIGQAVDRYSKTGRF
jgi:hypothetical protein